jgi:hypothetical protein
MTTHRRIRTHLSIGETDATWLYTGTNSLYRFYDGGWQCSNNVYYGKDKGWFNWSSEPSAFDESVYIEMLPTQQLDDPKFVAIISRYNQDIQQDSENRK